MEDLNGIQILGLAIAGLSILVALLRGGTCLLGHHYGPLNFHGQNQSKTCTRCHHTTTRDVGTGSWS